LYVIHRYYIFVFIDRANKDACLLACNLPTLDFFYLLDCLRDNGTGPDLSRSSV